MQKFIVIALSIITVSALFSIDLFRGNRDAILHEAGGIKSQIETRGQTNTNTHDPALSLGTPQNVIAYYNTAGGYIMVTWTPVTGAAGYKIFRAENSGGYSQVATLNALGNSYSDIEITRGAADKTYYYRVSAYKTGVESAQSASTGAVVPHTEMPPQVVASTFDLPYDVECVLVLDMEKLSASTNFIDIYRYVMTNVLSTNTTAVIDEFQLSNGINFTNTNSVKRILAAAHMPSPGSSPSFYVLANGSFNPSATSNFMSNQHSEFGTTNYKGITLYRTSDSGGNFGFCDTSNFIVGSTMSAAATMIDVTNTNSLSSNAVMMSELNLYGNNALYGVFRMAVTNAVDLSSYGLPAYVTNEIQKYALYIGFGIDMSDTTKASVSVNVYQVTNTNASPIACTVQVYIDSTEVFNLIKKYNTNH